VHQSLLFLRAFRSLGFLGGIDTAIDVRGQAAPEHGYGS